MGFTAIGLHSALIITVTATPEGSFGLLEGCLYLLAAVYHSIALIVATLLQTNDCVYAQLPGGNLTLAELNALQSEQ